ncbi:hypothetical protein AAFF_G00224740 [Aldrovandia affinis]|uniref:Uncharacterized protein n=1 Tax=Aldrovandia affinis TaxID=143900 RepID=A0AAD7TAY7_9TELE|nr:hypothetical protein AAFF_G00224740 [Aldrovandia affinis]
MALGVRNHRGRREFFFTVSLPLGKKEELGCQREASPFLLQRPGDLPALSRPRSTNKTSSGSFKDVFATHQKHGQCSELG